MYQKDRSFSILFISFVSMLIALNTAIANNEAEKIDEEVLKSVYSASTIMEVNYGEGEGEVKFRNVKGHPPGGPTSFAVTENYIYILDPLKDLVHIFDHNGNYIDEFYTRGPGDIVVDKKGTIYILGSIETIYEYNSKFVLVDEYRIPSYCLGELCLDKSEEICVRVCALGHDKPFSDGSKYYLPKSGTLKSYKEVRGASSPPSLNNYKILFTLNDTGQKVSIKSEKFIGSADFMGRDIEGNSYFLIEYLLFSDVEVEIRKYDANSKLIALIPFESDDIAYPDRKRILDRNGSIYHMRLLEDKLIIQKWTYK